MHQLVICGVCAQRLIRHTSNFTIKLFKLRFANVTKSSGKNCITIWRTLKIAERRCFTPGVSKRFVYFHELRLSQSSSYYVHCFCSAKTHCTLPCFTRLFVCPSMSILRRLTLTVYWCTAALFIFQITFQHALRSSANLNSQIMQKFASQLQILVETPLHIGENRALSVFWIHFLLTFERIKYVNRSCIQILKIPVEQLSWCFHHLGKKFSDTNVQLTCLLGVRIGSTNES